jgi:thioesterase domain-containing protein
VSETVWRGLIDGTLDLIDVPANHFTLMSPPHVQTLAEQVRRVLREAHSSGFVSAQPISRVQGIQSNE